MRAFSASGRGPDRVLQVNLDPETCLAIATLLDQVAELLAPTTRAGAGPVDPLAALTGMDPAAYAADAYGADGVRTPRAPFFTPDDPAVARLLPDAHRDDPALAEEFRRLTEHGLRRRKIDSLTGAAAALRAPQRPLRLSAELAQSLLTGLTDVRLVIAERLGLRTDEDAELMHEVVRGVLLDAAAGDVEAAEQAVREHPWLPAALQYDSLTELQEELVRALSRG